MWTFVSSSNLVGVQGGGEVADGAVPPGVAPQPAHRGRHRHQRQAEPSQPRHPGHGEAAGGADRRGDR